MQVIGTTLADHADDSGRVASVLGREIQGLDSKLLNRFQVRLHAGPSPAARAAAEARGRNPVHPETVHVGPSTVDVGKAPGSSTVASVFTTPGAICMS